MEVKFKVSGDILIAHIKGELDHHNAAPLRRGIDRSMKVYGCRDLILDLKGVEFMDSAGIGIALGRYKKLSKVGGRICIAGASTYIEKVLDMAGVFSIIHKKEDVQSALCFLGGEEQLYMEVCYGK